MDKIRQENSLDIQRMCGILKESGRIDTVEFIKDTGGVGYVFLSMPSNSYYDMISKEYEIGNFTSKYDAYKNIFNQVKRKLWLTIKQIEKYGKQT